MYIECGFDTGATLDYCMWLQSLRESNTWQSINTVDNMYREEVIYHLQDFDLATCHNIPFAVSVEAKVDLMSHRLVKITRQQPGGGGGGGGDGKGPKLPTIKNKEGVEICRAHADGNCKQRNCDRDHSSPEALAYKAKYRGAGRR